MTLLQPKFHCVSNYSVQPFALAVTDWTVGSGSRFGYVPRRILIPNIEQASTIAMNVTRRQKIENSCDKAQLTRVVLISSLTARASR